MKFRQFEFRLFPRIRSKKKKKPKFTNTDFPRDLSLDKNCNYSGPFYYNNSAFEQSFPSYFANKTYISGGYYGNCDNDCFYSCYQTFPFPELTIKVDTNCDCKSCTGSNPVLKYDVSPRSCVNPLSSEPETQLGTPHTVPRTRTRIKTNPWLPSPRETPSSSPTGTTKSLLASAESFPSPSTTDRQLLTVQCPNYHSLVSINEVEDTTDIDTDVPVTKTQEPCNYCMITADPVKHRTDDTSSEFLAYDNVNTTYDVLPDVSDYVPSGRITLPYVRHSAYDSNRFSFTDFLKYDSENSMCSSPVIETKENIANLTYDIEYEYEAEVNELLENQGIPKDSTFLSIKELMDDEYDVRMDHSTSDEVTSLSEYDNDHCVSDDANQLAGQDQHDASLDGADEDTSDVVRVSTSEDSIDGRGSNDRSAYVHSSQYDDGCMHESTDTGYASHAPESDIYTDSDNYSDEEFESIEEENELEWDNEPSTHNLQCNDKRRRPLCYSMSDRSRTCAPRRETRQRARSLADIELSLEDKVTQLREEKLFVQKKILEAKEEEIVRRQQLLKFKSVSTSNRKEVLLSTLHDLKTRLENQSHRLQTSYDTVLSLRKRLAQRRGSLKVLETNL